MKPERLEMGGPCWLLKLRWMGTHRVQMKGFIPWLFRWASRAGSRDFCSALAVPFGPSPKYFFPHRTLFSIPFSPIGQQAGQAVVLGRLSLNMCLWVKYWGRLDGPWMFLYYLYLLSVRQVSRERQAATKVRHGEGERERCCLRYVRLMNFPWIQVTQINIPCRKT